MTAHLRVWRRIRLFPGCRGISSFSFGVRGAHYTVGRDHNRATIGLPGTGIFVTDVERRRPKPERYGGLPYRAANRRPGDSVDRIVHVLLWLFALIAIGMVVMAVMGE